MPPSSKDLPFTSAGAWGQHHLGALQQPLLTISTHSAPPHETMCTHNVSSPSYRLRQAPPLWVWGRREGQGLGVTAALGAQGEPQCSRELCW